jgi:hypothetical protein
MIKKLNRFTVGFITACVLLVIITACVDNWVIDMREEELKEDLAKSMFEVDSLIKTIQYIYGDSLAK